MIELAALLAIVALAAYGVFAVCKKVKEDRESRIRMIRKGDRIRVYQTIKKRWCFTIKKDVEYIVVASKADGVIMAENGNIYGFSQIA